MKTRDLFPPTSSLDSKAVQSASERLARIVKSTLFDELEIRHYSEHDGACFVDCVFSGGEKYGTRVPLELINDQDVTDNQLAAILSFFFSSNPTEGLGDGIIKTY